MTELCLLTAEQLRRVYHTYIKRDFPRSERRPLSSIEDLCRTGRYDTWGAYEEDELLAYAFVWRTEDGRCALLDYLAVYPESRGQGRGAQVLELLKDKYGPDCPLLVEAEALEEGLPPDEDWQRRRRLAFYQRAGFRMLDYQTLIFGVRYAMLVWPAACTLEPETLQAAHRGLYKSHMPLFLFRRMIHIPAPDCGKKE